MPGSRRRIRSIADLAEETSGMRNRARHPRPQQAAATDGSTRQQAAAAGAARIPQQRVLGSASPMPRRRHRHRAAVGRCRVSCRPAPREQHADSSFRRDESLCPTMCRSSRSRCEPRPADPLPPEQQAKQGGWKRLPAQIRPRWRRIRPRRPRIWPRGEPRRCALEHWRSSENGGEEEWKRGEIALPPPSSLCAGLPGDLLWRRLGRREGEGSRAVLSAARVARGGRRGAGAA